MFFVKQNPDLYQESTQRSDWGNSMHGLYVEHNDNHPSEKHIFIECSYIIGND